MGIAFDTPLKKPLNAGPTFYCGNRLTSHTQACLELISRHASIISVLAIDLGTGYDYFGEVGGTDAVFLWEIADETVREFWREITSELKKGHEGPFSIFGGEGGIRTHGTL